MLDPSWTVLRLPMEYRPKRHCVTSWGSDWRTTVAGELLCPGGSAGSSPAKGTPAHLGVAVPAAPTSAADRVPRRLDHLPFGRPIPGCRSPFPKRRSDGRSARSPGTSQRRRGEIRTTPELWVWAKKARYLYLRDRCARADAVHRARRAALLLWAKWPGPAAIHSRTRQRRGHHRHAAAPADPRGRTASTTRNRRAARGDPHQPKGANCAPGGDQLLGPGNRRAPAPSIAPLGLSVHRGRTTAFPDRGAR